MHDGARARVLTWLAIAGTGSSILIMIVLSLLRDAWQHPPIVLPAWGPPWDLPPTHVSLGTASLALWIAVAVGTGGVVAGLAGLWRRRGRYGRTKRPYASSRNSLADQNQ